MQFNRQRREFITLVSGCAATWPLAARAQQPAMPVIGYLSAGAGDGDMPYTAAFREGLKEAGFVEGSNVAIEYRFADGHSERLLPMAVDLVSRQVSVIVSGGGIFTLLAAKSATTTIPIVFSFGPDPSGFGHALKLDRPDGNITGVYLASGLEAKRLDLLHEMVPTATIIAVLVNPNYVDSDNQLRGVQEAAARLGLQLVVVRANADSDFDAAFSTILQQRTGALLVCSSPGFDRRREQLVALAARHALPTIYERRDFAAAGGLMSYGPSFADGYHQVGVYAGRILKGAKPADLPVVQATRLELVINLSTAKALGVEVSPALAARADVVIDR
jgi:putative tryptophan/tyrosine transport system substrate-binding protein